MHFRCVGNSYLQVGIRLPLMLPLTLNLINPTCQSGTVGEGRVQVVWEGTDVASCSDHV